MYQFPIHFVLQIFFTIPLVNSGDDSDKPQFLRFKSRDILCYFYAPFDHRCRQAFINFKALEKVEIMMFDMGSLRLYLHHYRTYVFEEYAMADFMVS